MYRDPSNQADQSHHRAIQRFLNDWDSNPPEWWREAQYADEESLDQLMEELENEVVGEQGEGDWSVWLEEGCRPVPNG